MTEILMNGVAKKLTQKLESHSDDKITNAASEYKTVSEKRVAYNADIQKGGVYAINEKGARVLLGRRGAEFNDVEFIAGLWRIQNKFEHEITVVRNREFVLMKKLPYQERTKFEFYSAELVGNNCYGRSVRGVPDFIVARYGQYSAYGQTIEQARAFLGIRLYDEFQDLIHAEMHKTNSI